MKTTINDVAELAGVSIKTVSRVMNNEPGVRQATVEKVKTAAKQLNYQPNQSARSLAGNKAYMIGLVYDNPNAYYVIDMQNGILQACKKNNFELLIHPVNIESSDSLAELAQMLKHSRISGLILTPPLSEMQSVIEMIKASGIKLVNVLSGQKKSQSNDIPSVLVDDKTAAYHITEHLIKRGHQSIAFFSGDHAHQSSQQRLAGYKEALSAYRIPLNPAWIFDGKYSFESGVESCKRMLKMAGKPTAVFACNDEIAAGALFAARLNDLDVPNDLAIAGFEDNPFSRQTWPKLTTAAQPTKAIASEAAELLFKSFKTKPEEKAECIVFEPRLVVRQST